MSSNGDPKGDEWRGLNEGQRNCLMWPDFLAWDEPQHVTLYRTDQNEKLGLVSVTVQDAEKKLYYNILKRVKDNSLAQKSSINPYQWITAVNDKLTSHDKEAFNTHLKNAGNEIKLSLRKAVHPLSNVMRWGNEKTVILDVKEKKCGFELVHFYSKQENGNIEDHILVWDVKPEEAVECDTPLYRGDELLKVNDEPVQGQNSANIFKMILKAPGKVELTIKKIQRSNNQGPELGIEELRQSPDVNSNQYNSSTGNYDDVTQLIEPELHQNAEQENKERERFQTSPDSNFFSATAAMPCGDSTGTKKPQQESKMTRLSRRLSRGSRNGTQGDSKVSPHLKCGSTSSNDGYENSPQPRRKLSPTTTMCEKCVSTRATPQPDNRDLWTIDKIEPGCHGELCSVLDINIPTLPSIFIKLEGFSQQEVRTIQQQCSQHGGNGTADKALSIWRTRPGSNVGMLKKIYKDRTDVMRVLEKWEKLWVCYGCGRLLATQ